MWSSSCGRGSSYNPSVLLGGNNQSTFYVDNLESRAVPFRSGPAIFGKGQIMPAVERGFRIESRSCMQAIERAVRHGWSIDDATRDGIVDQLGDIIRNDTRVRWQIRATNLLALMTEERACG